ncbi:MAG: hypothetical protein K2M19_02045 [Muribaculaceae bacterium]|nr:hypothetical protein [Muribaculaceae bacterium]
MKQITFLLAVIACLSVSSRAAQPEVEVDGIVYSIHANSGNCYVKKYTAALPQNAVIHARVEIAEKMYDVHYIGFEALMQDDDILPKDHITSLTIETGDQPLRLMDCAVCGWTALEDIDLPDNTSQLDEGCLNTLPSLKVIWLRSTETVTFYEDYDRALNTSLYSNPILRVPQKLVSSYEALAAGSNEIASTFLGQMSKITSLDDSKAPVLTIRYEDALVTLHDAAEGHRLHFSSQTDRAISSLMNNEQDHTSTLKDGLYVVPAFDDDTLLHVTFEDN